MPNFSTDELMERLQAIDAPETQAELVTTDSPPAGQTGVADIGLAPMTGEEVTKQSSRMEQRISRQVTNRMPNTAEDVATQLGARRGIPLDTEGGLGFKDQLLYGLEPTDKDKLAFLEQKFPGKVRVNKVGGHVIEMTGEDGKPKDVLANPIGFNPMDLAGRPAIQMMGAVGATALLGAATGGASLAPGLGSAIANLFAATAGSQAAGAVSDASMRLGRGADVEPKEIAGRVAGDAAMELVTGAAGGLAAKGLGSAISPFSKMGRVQQEAELGNRYLQAKTGERVPLTPAELTGSGILGRLEAREIQMPGSSGVLQDEMRSKWEAVMRIRDRLMGGPPPGEEEAGKRAMTALGAEVAPLEQNVSRARAATESAAELEIRSGTMSFGPRIDKVQLGEQIRGKAFQERETFRAESKKRYAAVFSDPRTQVKNIPGDELANDAQQLLDKLPTAKGEVIEEFVPAGVRSKLEALTELRGEQMRLDELMQMRTEVSNAIAEGEAIPGVKTRQLNEIKEFLTKRIKTGLRAIDPALETKWQDANDFYAQNVGRFQRHGIAEMFREPTQGNFVENSTLVRRATQGPASQDFYQAYRDFFGPGSPEMDAMRQAIREDALGLPTLSHTIDPKGFAARLEALSDQNPDALVDAFGMNAQQLRQSAKVLEAARGGTLPESELVEAMNSGTLSATRLSEMLNAQRARDTAYGNELVRKVAKGNLEGDSIPPHKFVDTLVFNPDMSPGQVREVMAYFAGRPEVLEDVRRLSFQKVLDRATMVNREGGFSMLDPKVIEAAIDDQTGRERLSAAMGLSGVEDLRALAAVLKPGDLKYQAFRATGQFAASAQIGLVFEQGDLRYIDQAAKNFLMATVYTSPVTRNWMRNTKLSAEDKAGLVRTFVISGPMIESILATYGEEQGMEMAARIRAGLDQADAANGVQRPAEGNMTDAELEAQLNQR
jgi:hypothetical protein